MAYTDKGPEAKTRHEIINPMLEKAGWIVQNFKSASVHTAKGVAVEYFQMGTGVGEADYVLFINIGLMILELNLMRIMLNACMLWRKNHYQLEYSIIMTKFYHLI